MPLATRVEPINRDVQLIINDLLSPAAQARQFAIGAQAFLDDADETNRSIMGRIPPSRTYVDGSESTPVERVSPNGVIVREYELISDVLLAIGNALRAVSPTKSGRYQASHTLFADGTQVLVGEEVPIASEYVFLSDVPYARKIEGSAGRPPQSPQAPKGVYQITAAKMSRQFGNIARISFAWRAPFIAYGGAPSSHSKRGGKWHGGAEWQTRVPAIIVTLGR